MLRILTALVLILVSVPRTQASEAVFSSVFGNADEISILILSDDGKLLHYEFDFTDIKITTDKISSFEVAHLKETVREIMKAEISEKEVISPRSEKTWNMTTTLDSNIILHVFGLERHPVNPNHGTEYVRANSKEKIDVLKTFINGKTHQQIP